MIVEQRRPRTPTKPSLENRNRRSGEESKSIQRRARIKKENTGEMKKLNTPRKNRYWWTRQAMQSESTSRDKHGTPCNLDGSGRGEQETYKMADIILEQETQVGTCQDAVRLEETLL